MFLFSLLYSSPQVEKIVYVSNLDAIALMPSFSTAEPSVTYPVTRSSQDLAPEISVEDATLEAPIFHKDDEEHTFPENVPDFQKCISIDATVGHVEIEGSQ